LRFAASERLGPARDFRRPFFEQQLVLHRAQRPRRLSALTLGRHATQYRAATHQHVGPPRQLDRPAHDPHTNRDAHAQHQSYARSESHTGRQSYARDTANADAPNHTDNSAIDAGNAHAAQQRSPTYAAKLIPLQRRADSPLCAAERGAAILGLADTLKPQCGAAQLDSLVRAFIVLRCTPTYVYQSAGGTAPLTGDRNILP